MHDLLSVGGVFGSCGLNTIWRQVYFLEFIVSKYNFWIKWFLRYLLPKVGHFQVLIMSEGIHRNQVFLHQNVVQTLLYWNQLKPLAQNCAKNYYLHSPTGVLCSNLAIISILLWFDGKNCTFDLKTWSYFWQLFHTVD